MQHHMSILKSSKVRNAFLACVLALSLAMPTSAAFAEPTAAQKQAEAQSTLASLNDMQQKLDQASNDYHQALEEQEAAQAKMDEAQGRIDDANDRITKQQGKLGTRVRDMYRTGNLSFFDVLFGSASFDEFATKLDLLNQINQEDASLIQEVKDLRSEVSEQKEEYSNQEQIAAEKADKAKEIKDDAEKTVASMQETYDQLTAEAADLLAKERAAADAAAAASSQNVVNSSASGGSSYNYNIQTGNTIVDTAYAQIGKPYVWAAAGPNTFDCSGLVQYCYAAAGISTAHYTGVFMGYRQVSNPQPGDICTNWEHCGIYIGGGMMIHAPMPGMNVMVGPVQSGMIIVRP